MNEDRFFYLAMKVIARQATTAEHDELSSLVSYQPRLQSEFEQLQESARIAEDVLHLVSATESTTGELPAYARGRLQSKVRQTFPRPQSTREQKSINPPWLTAWRTWLGLTFTAAASVIFLMSNINTGWHQLNYQIAVLDLGGASRGNDTQEIDLIQQNWKGAILRNFANRADLNHWEKQWRTQAAQSAVKVVYDRTEGEVRVVGRWQSKPFEKVFAIDQDLSATLKQVNEFIQTQSSMQSPEN
jgi:hypothetical protein